MNLIAALPYLLALGLPLVLALALLHPHGRPAVLALMPWTPLPALVLAILGRANAVIDLPWLLLGMRLGVDATSQVFLGLTALLWLLCGVCVRSYMAQDEALYRFVAFYLVTMSGNLGLILAQDMLSFFLFFAVMSFAAYGLIVHHRNTETRWAGLVYMTLVVLSEVLLFAAMTLAASSAENVYFPEVQAAIAQSSSRDLIIALTLAGFGIKVGMLPLHVSLPLIYRAAPIPAAAVLSGAMVKAGLLGWLRLLPLGGPALPVWGTFCLVVGLVAAFYGVAIGVTQRNAKAVLAYSSVSQMGLITMMVGVALLVPSAWSMIRNALWVYVLHHAFAKGALFLSIGVVETLSGQRWQRGLVAVGLLLPAFALAGAPLSTGALAKAALKTATTPVPPPWPDVLGSLLPLTAVGTTLLMGRFLVQIWAPAPTHMTRRRTGLWLPWAVAASGLPVMALLLPWDLFIDTVQHAFVPSTLWSTLWPVGVGVLAVGGIYGGLHGALGLRMPLYIPAGDLLVPVSELLVRLWRRWCISVNILRANWSALVVAQWYPGRSDVQRHPLLIQLEDWFGRWSTAGVLFILLTAVFFALLMRA